MKNNDEKGILYERALITCLIMLLISILFKLFGASWFDLNTDISLLQEMDSIIENDIVFSFIVTLFFKTINGILICSLMVRDISKVLKGIWLIVSFNIISMVMNFYNVNSFFVDFFYPCLISYLIAKINLKESLLIMILNVIYQLVSLYIRNLGYVPQSYSFIYYTLLSLDYYIMLVITYLLMKKGDKNICGVVVACYSFLKCRLWKKHSKDYSIDNE